MEKFTILLSLTICGGLFAAALVMVSHKWNLFAHYNKFRSRWKFTRFILPRQCELCIMFWVNVLLGVLLFVFGAIPFWIPFIIYPFAAAALGFRTL